MFFCELFLVGPTFPRLLNKFVLQSLWPKVLKMESLCDPRPSRLVCIWWRKQVDA